MGNIGIHERIMGCHDIYWIRLVLDKDWKWTLVKQDSESLDPIHGREFLD